VEILIKTGKLRNVRTNLMVVFLFQETHRLEGWLKTLDSISGGRVGTFLKLRDFRGELNETALLYFQENAGIRRLLLVGMAKSKKIRRITMCLMGMDITGIPKTDFARAAAESSIMSLYKFTQYKTDDKNNDEIKQISLFDVRRVHLDELREGAELGRFHAEATCYARDLASHPGNVVTPSFFEEQARAIAKESGLKCTVLGPDEMKSRNMNALLGVAQGSRQEPRLIMLEYDCGNSKADKVAIVGKGLTFDSGGISLKPSKKMEEMKFDMCGAAAVLSVMKIAHLIKPPVNVVGVIASAENMPGGGAIKPGDIMKTYSGLTVEVINTDAEGRLVLCDALAYTIDTVKPNAVVDIATLTGAVVVALGHYATGMLGNNPPLLKKMTTAGEQSGEMVWELPLYPEYDEHIKSDYADIKNSNGPGGGTIFGAAFLKKFVGKTPWIHLDIAGTAWDVKEKPYLPKGPTGVGVRLLSQFLTDW